MRLCWCFRVVLLSPIATSVDKSISSSRQNNEFIKDILRCNQRYRMENDDIDETIK